MKGICFNGSGVRVHAAKRGFTLIELSIVLVIIGLIVGGVLVGQSLISAAAVRAQISQIEKFNSAANTFYGKYGYLPGDIPAGPAAQFGFAPRGPYVGQGDGNGTLAGNANNGSNGSSIGGNRQDAGETVMFWVDLSTAGLIEGGFNTASSTAIPSNDITGADVSLWLPQAKLGSNNYIYVWSPFTYSGTATIRPINYFGLSGNVTIAASSNNGKLESSTTLSVSQAKSIDQKVDDGYPQSGNVFAVYINGDPEWTDGTNTVYSPPNTGATAGSSTSCYDNGNVAGGTQKYSVEISNGSNINCALSFKMQAGD